MNNIDVLLIPEERFCKEKELGGKLIVVIDVLRASSTIVTALARGCNGFIPIFSPDEAKDKAKIIGQKLKSLRGLDKGAARLQNIYGPLKRSFNGETNSFLLMKKQLKQVDGSMLVEGK